MTIASPRLRSFLAIAGLAAAYFITGRLGLLLAIPPGYATAIWPASGIALAAVLIWGYRVWPGILIGSFLVNIGVSLDTANTETILRSIGVAAGIGVGATLQGLAGAFLVRRWVGFPSRLDDERQVGLFLLLGGPVGCLVNASWSVTFLFLTGSISPENFLFTWWTWWVGDTIGVLTITPLVLVWLSPGPWIWRQRRLTMTVPLAATFALAVALFIQASSWEQDRIRREFFRQADAVAAALQGNIDSYLEVLKTTRDFQLATPAFDREAFRAFVARPLERHPGIVALSWNPRVPIGERDAYEGALQAQGDAGFRIVERDDAGQLVPAGWRNEYVVVTFIEPRRSHQAAVGYDVASDPVRRQALDRARDTAEAVATAGIHLVQADNVPGMLVFQPVYRQDQANTTVDERRQGLMGYMVGVFQIPHLVAAALTGLDTEEMAISLTDGDTPLFARRTQAEAVAGHGMTRDARIVVAGRTWRLAMAPTTEYLVRHRSWQAWSVLVAGLLFTSLLGAFLLVITGRTGRVEMLVEERTRELADANRQLTEEVALRKASEQALQDKNIELATASRAKDSFLATMSHELRTPMNAIIGFTGTLLMRLAGPLTTDQESQLQTVQTSARHLLSLINDLLDLTQIEAGKVEIRPEPLSCSDLIGEVTATLKPLADKKGVALEVRLPEEETAVCADRRALSQIVINLVNNAIKFTDRGSVTVELLQGAGGTAIRVSDTGCGIRAEDQGRLFQAFTQLDSSFSRRHEGTGLGLHLSARLAELMGGRIACESEFGKGSVFTLELPPDPPPGA